MDDGPSLADVSTDCLGSQGIMSSNSTDPNDRMSSSLIRFVFSFSALKVQAISGLSCMPDDAMKCLGPVCNIFFFLRVSVLPFTGDR